MAKPLAILDIERSVAINKPVRLAQWRTGCILCSLEGWTVVVATHAGMTMPVVVELSHNPENAPRTEIENRTNNPIDRSEGPAASRRLIYWLQLGHRGYYFAMAPTSIREAIEWIRSCPTMGPYQNMMIRVLSNHESEFSDSDLQFTVSMYMSLNVILDDRHVGIRGPEHLDQKWFTLGPNEDDLILRLGNGAEVVQESVRPEIDAAELIQTGIRHIAGST